MKYLIQILLFVVIFSSCKKEEESSEIILTSTEFVEFGTCFLEYRIDSSEVVITDSLSYVAFEKALKNNWDLSGSCNNAHLPTVDFKKALLVGKLTKTTCTNNTYTRQIVFNSNLQKYIYRITLKHSKNCGNLAESSFNWAIVPKMGSTNKFIFEISEIIEE
ncbi:MAG: hypothetical protein JEZ09_09335 [Salinivirgaceae bacterium]|nr:hypothetical protein [Salinivirgaceae bacterium]